MRDANYIIDKAKKRGENIGLFAERLLSGDFPWKNLRQSQKMMRMCDKYGEKILDAACDRALRFDLINVRRLETIVKNALESKQESILKDRGGDRKIIQLPLRFLRDNRSFIHESENRE
jgi:hypothetical protein